MAARDVYHEAVKAALANDGWKITHDPLIIKWGLKDLFVDLGAEQLVAAERAGQQIAVEIKSFVGPSEVEDLKNALGTHILYHDILARLEPNRLLYLAVREAIFLAVFEEPIGKVLLDNGRIRLLVFDPQTEVIVKWIHS
jgi:hypothetical protein